MIHALLVLALVVFLIWLFLHTIGAIVHLLWIVILAALVIWAARFLLQRTRT